MSNSRLLVLASILLTGLLMPQAHAAIDRQITVTGKCSRRAVPDRGAVTLTADFTDPDLATAIHQATRAYEQALASIRKLGLADFEAQTVESSVSEDRDWQNGKSIFRGYHSRMGLRITTSETARLGQVIPLASREGIHDVSGLSTFLSAVRQEKEKDLCLKDAGENAREKAQKLAASVGASIGEPLQLIENPPASGREPVRPLMMQSVRRNQVALEAPPTIETGTEEISVTIEAVFALKAP